MYEIFIKHLFKPDFIICCNIVIFIRSIIGFFTGYKGVLDVPGTFFAHFLIALYETIVEIKSNKNKK
ncbi:MAG: hypothetical protein PT934_02160 [Peptoniphilaceae bacterium]|uniref:hypothetical protein n=1 Tax=Parvimonas sp. TaxID=1944660 RepID=UPI0025DA145D|nr:hypothetical protein [Parvimonas sp.]MCI5997844.1 hypothetical protein [Parvimonas sp.]MDD7764553.1 hypothetical protein [Peptoniphilaceae bacterium]MDY3050531.1 hypothetical protein [Parvimonas sp.]